jgi:4-carboxymuconolactone decarboxylase
MPYFLVVWREICANCAASAITSAHGQAGASGGLGGNAPSTDAASAISVPARRRPPGRHTTQQQLEETIMALVPYIELPDMPPSVQPLMQQVPPLNIFKALANSKAVVTGLVELGRALRATETLDKRLKELIILRVGFQSRATYEVFQHRQVARVLDITPEKVDALQGSLDAEIFSPLERDVLRLTDALLENVKAPAELLAPVAEALSPGQLVEVITVVGLYMLICRILETLEIDVEDDQIMAKLPTLFAS